MEEKLRILNKKSYFYEDACYEYKFNINLEKEI